MNYQNFRTEHNDIPPEFVDKKKYLCSECPEIYFNKGNFNTHVFNHKEWSKQKMKQYTCKTCQMTISGWKNYTTHAKNRLL